MAFDAWKKLVRGLSRTREGIATSLKTAFQAHVVDEAALGDIETSLLASDLGPSLTGEVLEEVRRQAQSGELDGAGLREAIRAALRRGARRGAGAGAGRPASSRASFSSSASTAPERPRRSGSLPRASAPPDAR